MNTSLTERKTLENHYSIGMRLVTSIATILFILFIFGGSYISLYYASLNIITLYLFLVMAIVFVIAGTYVSQWDYIPERWQNICGIFAGLFIWSIFGEITGYLGLIRLSEFGLFPILLAADVFFVILLRRKFFEKGTLFVGLHFMLIWNLHWTAINQLHFYDAFHWTAFAFTLPVVLLGSYSLYTALQSRSDKSTMIWSMVFILCFWTMLEYAFAWDIIGRFYR